MIRRHAFLPLLLSGLVMGSAAMAQDSAVFRSEVEVSGTPSVAGFRELSTREERAGRTVERTVVEASSINGGVRVLSEVVDEAAQIAEGTSRRTRQEFITDTNGRRRLVTTTTTTEEHRVDRSGGGQRIIRGRSEQDVNGRSRATRREREERVAEAGGVFRTEIEVSEPIVSGRRFLATERVEQREHRDGELVLELDRTTYADPTGRGTWEATERRVLNREADGEGNRAVETVYRSNGASDLVLSERIVSKEWTGSGGTEHRTEEVFTRDIPNQVRSAEPKLFQQIEMRRATWSNGGWTTTRTVKEPSSGRMRIVERLVERARPDGRGGTVIEREVQRLNVNGRFETTHVNRTRESSAAAR